MPKWGLFEGPDFFVNRGQENLYGVGGGGGGHPVYLKSLQKISQARKCCLDDSKGRFGTFQTSLKF